MPGNLFIIHGHLIKSEGPDPTNGLYLVPVAVPGSTIPLPPPVKLVRLADNTSNKITGIIPGNISWSNFKVEVRTQFSSSTTLLKEPRIITSKFTIEHI